MKPNTTIFLHSESCTALSYCPHPVSGFRSSVSVSYYSYDEQGTRTRKVVVKGNIREERYYLDGYELFRKYENGGLVLERHTTNLADDEKVFARIDEGGNEGLVTRYQYDNHLGSACLELDECADIISYEEYHPFGTTSYRSRRSETEVSLKRYRYCGKERDEETGLYYYGMRYYAAWLCRFVSVDPLQFKYPELTPYQYASNNPITMIDLDGLEGVKPEEAPTEGNSETQKKLPPTSLMINPNDTEAKKDILSIVEIEYLDYVKITDAGRILLDFQNIDEKNIKEILQKSPGLKIISDIISATKEDGTGYSFFYGTQGPTGVVLAPTVKWEGEHYSANMSLSGINTIDDSHGGYFPQYAVVSASTQPYNKDGTQGGYIPNDSYDAKVFIRKGTFKNVEDVEQKMYDPETKTIVSQKIGEKLELVSRADLIYHELRESYFRTIKGMPYNKAHKKAKGTGAVDRYFP